MSIRNKHLIDAFNFYISKRGGEFHEWYISNTNDGTGSLVDEHGVDIDSGYVHTTRRCHSTEPHTPLEHITV